MSEHLRKPDWLKIRWVGTNSSHEQKASLNPTAAYDLHQREMSEYGRMLEQGDGYLYDCGRYLYAFLPFLQYVDRQTASVGPEGTCECGGKHPTDELKHAVITSVDRDDLPDLGAQHWVDTIRTIKAVNPETTVEVLIPDFRDGWNWWIK